MVQVNYAGTLKLNTCPNLSVRYIMDFVIRHYPYTSMPCSKRVLFIAKAESEVVQVTEITQS